MKNKFNETQYDVTADSGLDDLNAKFNSMIKEIMGRRNSSTIAKKCGVSVSTITRLRNGDNKRGISDDLLKKLWDNRSSDCEVDEEQLRALNSEVSNAYMQQENARWRQERQEIVFLEDKIQKSMLSSGVFFRPVKGPYQIVSDVEIYPDMSYEIAFESGEKRALLFFTQFYSKRRITQLETRKQETPDYPRFYCRHYRTILDFEEFRTQHQEYENAELVIVFNYEDAFRYNAETLKQLSNRDRVALALMDSDSGRLLDEICLDEREEGILKELKLV